MVRADEEFVERVLSIVESVPPGRATTYGAIAEVVGSGPRLIGNVLARHGGGVPWWRVVRADGTLPPSHLENARPRYLEEGTPMRRGRTAVDLAAAGHDVGLDIGLDVGLDLGPDTEPDGGVVSAGDPPPSPRAAGRAPGAPS